MGDVRDPAEVGTQPTLAARGMFTEIDDRAGGQRQITQSPYHFLMLKAALKDLWLIEAKTTQRFY